MARIVIHEYGADIPICEHCGLRWEPKKATDTDFREIPTGRPICCEEAQAEWMRDWLKL